jgi:hypothetical protein
VPGRYTTARSKPVSKVRIQGRGDKRRNFVQDSEIKLDKYELYNKHPEHCILHPLRSADGSRSDDRCNRSVLLVLLHHQDQSEGITPLCDILHGDSLLQLVSMEQMICQSTPTNVTPADGRVIGAFRSLRWINSDALNAVTVTPRALSQALNLAE